MLPSEDKQWYRAKVLAYSLEERVCVSYLDFGNSEEVDLSQLRPITAALLAVPVQAICCGLEGKMSDEQQVFNVLTGGKVCFVSVSGLLVTTQLQVLIFSRFCLQLLDLLKNLVSVP